ncbi:DNA (cytosine-5)-methyltransferase 1 [Paenibacillus sp. LBL]|uniref:DNA cytosine methyltransferase n=1 Tax=Paenibacillus sp. LBL TaxID=2940563 RepID=UPI0024743523|nr:DNA (cytosine-5-)-methyltransferase [Paenibacillus sp. LBL]MDH6674292.1 DNA (cytosine-5)-methyltransferase 1 [Paenibacillus sp. LBL]
MAQELRLNDFFCGCGGIGLGFKNAGFTIAKAWDVDPYAVKSYMANVDSNVEQRDISEMTYRDVPYADVWSFGFPCQDLSSAGSCKGIYEGSRSRLFFEIMRLLNELRQNDPTRLPKMIIAENVKGVKKYLSVIENEYQKNGYSMQYQLIDSAQWGVPQKRERYYMVGLLEGVVSKFDFPIPSRKFCSMKAVLQFDVPEKYYVHYEKSVQIVASYLGPEIEFEVAQNRPLSTVSEYITGYYSQKDGFKQSDISNTIDATYSKGLGSNQYRPAIIERYEVDVFRVRKLTPSEYGRLQGFPWDWIQVVSDSQAYKQFGNAVTVNVSNAISNAMKNSIRR